MRKTRTTLLIIAATLLLSVTAFASEPQTFTDVPPDSPYYDAVEYMHERGIVNGCGDGRFCPNSKVTVEQFWTIYLRFYFPEECTTMLSSDTDTPYTELAQTLNIIVALPELWDALTDSYTEEYMWRFVYDATGIAPYPKWMYTNEEPVENQNDDVRYAAYLMGLTDRCETTNYSVKRGELVLLLYRIEMGDYTPLPEVQVDWYGMTVEEDPACWRERNQALYELTLLPEKYIEAFVENGWKLDFCESIEVKYPDHVSVLNIESGNLAGICMYGNVRTIAIHPVSSCKPNNVLIHEFAHFISDLVTQRDYLRNIYEAEVDNIAMLIGRNYPKTNEDEAFAEAFRYIVRNRNNEHMYETMQYYIPLTLAYIERGFLDADGCYDIAMLDAVTKEYRDYAANRNVNYTN